MRMGALHCAKNVTPYIESYEFLFIQVGVLTKDLIFPRVFICEITSKHLNLDVSFRAVYDRVY